MVKKTFNEYIIPKRKLMTASKDKNTIKLHFQKKKDKIANHLMKRGCNSNIINHTTDN